MHCLRVKIFFSSSWCSFSYSIADPWVHCWLWIRSRPVTHLSFRGMGFAFFRSLSWLEFKGFVRAEKVKRREASFLFLQGKWGHVFESRSIHYWIWNLCIETFRISKFTVEKLKWMHGYVNTLWERSFKSPSLFFPKWLNISPFQLKTRISHSLGSCICLIFMAHSFSLTHTHTRTHLFSGNNGTFIFIFFCGEKRIPARAWKVTRMVDLPRSPYGLLWSHLNNNIIAHYKKMV